MSLDEFLAQLNGQSTDAQILDFCRKRVLHGTPSVFAKRDDDFYEFRKKIAVKFEIPFHEVYITGSAKLGFSPFKRKDFDLDSDVDVAIVSPALFERIMSDISEFQWRFKKNRAVVRESELYMYHDFLEYVVLGWIRPDKLPISFQMIAFKNDWFDFFRSISYGNSEVGNYEVNAGVFKSYVHLEKYTYSGIKSIYNKRKLRTEQ
jgi:hypothetical protein